MAVEQRIRSGSATKLLTEEPDRIEVHTAQLLHLLLKAAVRRLTAAL